MRALRLLFGEAIGCCLTRRLAILESLSAGPYGGGPSHARFGRFARKAASTRALSKQCVNVGCHHFIQTEAVLGHASRASAEARQVSENL